VAFAGGTLAVVGAVLASPLLPVGIARRADPDLGVHFDAAVLIWGGLAIALVVLLIGFLASIRAARRSAFEETVHAEPASIASAAAQLSPVPAAGFRMALSPGRGRTAVPVRSACFGAIFGVLGIVAVLVFAA